MPNECLTQRIDRNEVLKSNVITNEQFGFMPSRGMADAILAVWQRMEKQGRRTIECLVKKSGGAIGRRDCQIIM